MPKESDLRVWWIPRFLMKAFYYEVHSVEDACILCDCLAKYDKFQLDNNIKPDYSSAGGLQVFEDGLWFGCFDYNDNDFDEYMKEYIEKYNE
ncbi:hypothetical protein LCGC14_1681480 [marine sediment metagenome]|uniref:Uncharacterized protein n=1 Tax=marine sediment metagenome TaxID=412755 RepID=A0A0F9HNX0_9ZZZZ